MQTSVAFLNNGTAHGTLKKNSTETKRSNIVMAHVNPIINKGRRHEASAIEILRTFSELCFFRNSVLGPFHPDVGKPYSELCVFVDLGVRDLHPDFGKRLKNVFWNCVL